MDTCVPLLVLRAIVIVALRNNDVYTYCHCFPGLLVVHAGLKVPAIGPRS